MARPPLPQRVGIASRVIVLINVAFGGQCPPVSSLWFGLLALSVGMGLSFIGPGGFQQKTRKLNRFAEHVFSGLVHELLLESHL